MRLKKLKSGAMRRGGKKHRPQPAMARRARGTPRGTALDAEVDAARRQRREPVEGAFAEPSGGASTPKGMSPPTSPRTTSA